MDVLFRLDGSLPKARAVERSIRDAIARGDLPQSARLPGSRELAIELGVARNTVVAAIDDLVAEGVLEARARAGVFVARGTSPTSRAHATSSGIRLELDLRPGQPEHGSFPTARWLAATRRASSSIATGVSDGAGVFELRSQLAAYLGRARGVETTADSIVICAGFRTACTLLAAALASRSARSVAIEDPSLPMIDLPWRAAGFEVTDLPVDHDGAEVARLGKETDAVVLTPSHQFPIGGVLAPGRRQIAVDWATTNESVIIEDDYDGEFRFDRRPVAALQRSAPEHIIYVGSSSKTLDPGLRLGWLALPHDLVQAVVEASDALTGGAPVLNQLALAHLIRSGDYERHIRRQRREYARRRDHLQRALVAAGHDVPGIPAGLHALIPVSDEQAIGLSNRGTGGVAVHMLSRYSRSYPQRSAIVAGFATPPRIQFEPAVKALVDLLEAPGVDRND